MFSNSVVQSLICVQLFVTPWTAARQDSLHFTISRIRLKLMSIKLVMLSNYVMLCHPLLLLPSIFPSIRVFSNESAFLFASGGHAALKKLQICLTPSYMVEVSINWDMQMTPPLMIKSEEELKSLLMKVKEESEKADLKLNIQKTKVMASDPSLHGK